MAIRPERTDVRPLQIEWAPLEQEANSASCAARVATFVQSHLQAFVDGVIRYWNQAVDCAQRIYKRMRPATPAENLTAFVAAFRERIFALDAEEAPQERPDPVAQAVQNGRTLEQTKALLFARSVALQGQPSGAAAEDIGERINQVTHAPEQSVAPQTVVLARVTVLVDPPKTAAKPSSLEEGDLPGLFDVASEEQPVEAAPVSQQPVVELPSDEELPPLELETPKAAAPQEEQKVEETADVVVEDVEESSSEAGDVSESGSAEEPEEVSSDSEEETVEEKVSVEDLMDAAVKSASPARADAEEVDDRPWLVRKFFPLAKE